MNLQFILQSQPGGFMSYLPLIVMFIIIYVFFILPSRKKAKEQASFSDSLQKGDVVVTSSGIIGSITRVGDKDVTISTEGKTYLKLTKSAISKEMTDFYKDEGKK